MYNDFINKVQNKVPVLLDDDAHVLFFHLNHFQPYVSDLYKLLAEDEQQKADNFFL